MQPHPRSQQGAAIPGAIRAETAPAEAPAALLHTVAAPDSYYGEVPVAYLELTEGQHLTEAQVIDFCLDQIATYKLPRYVRFVDRWPMSGTKIRKVELRQCIRDDLAASQITETPRLSSRRAVRSGGR